MAKRGTKLRLKELREAAGLTQEQCAAKLEMGLGKYINYETGKSEPRYEFLLQAADFYGVSMDDLLCHKRTREHIFTEQQLDFLGKVRRLSVSGKNTIKKLVRDTYEAQSQ